MNRRDLLLGLAAAPVAVSVDRFEQIYYQEPRGPYNTDDPYYDKLLDEMLGEEWS